MESAPRFKREHVSALGTAESGTQNMNPEYQTQIMQNKKKSWKIDGECGILGLQRLNKCGRNTKCFCKFYTRFQSSIKNPLLLIVKWLLLLYYVSLYPLLCKKFIYIVYLLSLEFCYSFIKYITIFQELYNLYKKTKNVNMSVFKFAYLLSHM